MNDFEDKKYLVNTILIALIIYLRSALVLLAASVKFYYYNLLNCSKRTLHSFNCNWLLFKNKNANDFNKLFIKFEQYNYLVYLLLNLNHTKYFIF